MPSSYGFSWRRTSNGPFHDSRRQRPPAPSGWASGPPLSPARMASDAASRQGGPAMTCHWIWSLIASGYPCTPSRGGAATRDERRPRQPLFWILQSGPVTAIGGVRPRSPTASAGRSSIGRDTHPTPTWSAMVCSDTRPTVTLSLRPCTRLRAPGRALPIVVALRHRPGGAVRPRPPYACAGPLEPYRREARRARRVVRCAPLGPPHEPGPARSAASTCQLHSSSCSMPEQSVVCLYRYRRFFSCP
jgi:hypothetical protein